MKFTEEALELGPLAKEEFELQKSMGPWCSFYNPNSEQITIKDVVDDAPAAVE